jgi:hypothetical protein
MLEPSISRPLFPLKRTPEASSLAGGAPPGHNLAVLFLHQLL